MTCMRGEEAARLFYDEERFRRADALPRRVRALVGEGGVQTLDDDAHRHRKQLFTELMRPDAVAALDAVFAETWARHVTRWERGQGPVVLYDRVGELLCEAVCAWAASRSTPATSDGGPQTSTP